MKITAISDIHGSLIQIDPTDLLIIAGDWSPLEIQTDIWYMREWVEDCLLHWFKEIPADKIIFIAGNHDFICDPNFYASLGVPDITFKKNILDQYLKNQDLTKKVVYLENSSVKYKGYKIFGTPYVEGCRGWAFSQGETKGVYKSIPKCDILITHQPPIFGRVGVTKINGVECELGSWSLTESILKNKPNYHFCGHIHEGDHVPQIYNHPD